MPISLTREQKFKDIITIQRGSEYDLGKVLDPMKRISVEMGVAGKVNIDFACFGVDAASRVNEQFCIFYNRTNSPGNEISLKDGNANPALFRLELSRLPQVVKRLIFTASVRDPGSMLNILGMDVEIRQNNAGFHLQFSGSDFSTYKSIIVIELSLSAIWQLEATVAGFDGDLGGLMEHLGVEVDKGSSQGEASAEPVVQRDGKIWIDGEEFVVDPEKDWV
ncbi:MAG: TerD family protein [Treponema sp.]|jgi:stress response protein SCP2|nr:TerD family protein [Treponema sp.]